MLTTILATRPETVDEITGIMEKGKWIRTAVVLSKSRRGWLLYFYYGK